MSASCLSDLYSYPTSSSSFSLRAVVVRRVSPDEVEPIARTFC